MKRIVPLFLLALALASTVHASEDGTLSLSPAVVMLRGDHGQSTTQTLTLLNGTSRPFEFELVAQDVVTRDGKRTFAEAGSIAGSIAATAVFSQKQVRIAPGESASVTVTVTLPPGTSQRAVVALFRGTNMVMSGQVPMRASLGSLLTFATADTAEMDAAPLSVRPQSASANLAVSHACTNSGKEPFVANGVLAIVDGNGALVGKSKLESRRLLPGESVELGGEYPGELAAGPYRVYLTYEYAGRTLTRSAEVRIP
jgi:hypothetical protein